MRKFFFFGMILIAFSSISIARSSNDSLWKAAAEAYRNKAYEQALADYDSLINRGYSSAVLFNNAGNAAFKSKHLGKAVWCYEKAYRLDPCNEEIKYNKDLMRYKTLDRVEELPSIAPISWLNRSSLITSPIVWYWLGIIVIVVFTLSLFLRHKGILKKAWLSGISIFIAINLFVLAFNSHHLIYGREMAVIQFPSVGILSAPDATGVEVFQLHEGTLVEIKGMQGNWQKIRLADGKEGWMSKEAARGF